ncbi:hypothetical protein LCGC14_2606610 [marine sediment metagenome]|uniref:Uncharacterized protein n=1 Tax=marine sediment metagenome TaxID=412755 RepID=A0A0F9CI61_9ZZZZ
MADEKKQRIWRDGGWGGYIDRARHREGMDAAEVVDNAFADCVACGQSVGHEDLAHGYCTVEDSADPKNTPCAEKRVFIGEGTCIATSSFRSLKLKAGDLEVWVECEYFCKGNTLRKVGDQGVFVIRRWVAQQKGLT